MVVNDLSGQRSIGPNRGAECGNVTTKELSGNYLCVIDGVAVGVAEIRPALNQYRPGWQGSLQDPQGYRALFVRPVTPISDFPHTLRRHLHLEGPGTPKTDLIVTYGDSNRAKPTLKRTPLTEHTRDCDWWTTLHHRGSAQQHSGTGSRKLVQQRGGLCQYIYRNF